MPDVLAPEIVEFGLDDHVEELCAFFIQCGLSPCEAADAIGELVYEAMQFYGTRH
jgi:hypothetical protein